MRSEFLDRPKGKELFLLWQEAIVGTIPVNGIYKLTIQYVTMILEQKFRPPCK
jgi:hypothetical protein